MIWPILDLVECLLVNGKSLATFLCPGTCGRPCWFSVALVPEKPGFTACPKLAGTRSLRTDGIQSIVLYCYYRVAFSSSSTLELASIDYRSCPGPTVASDEWNGL